MPTPRLKVFDASGQYQAACHDYAAAAVLMGLYGEGASVRLGHSKRDTIWTEGQDGLASENFDLVGEALGRADARSQAAFDKMTGAAA